MTGFILASASPRRLELLMQIGKKPLQTFSVDIDETPLFHELPSRYVMRMAEKKAMKAVETYHNHFILTADTVVACGRRILQKPQNEKEAYQMLSLLSGRRHRVYGAVCLVLPDGKICKKLVKTSVVFKVLSESDKKEYIADGEWEGKAGGYAIQGKAALFIRQIIGSYSNVVGLPLFETGALLKGNGL